MHKLHVNRDVGIWTKTHICRWKLEEPRNLSCFKCWQISWL